MTDETLLARLKRLDAELSAQGHIDDEEMVDTLQEALPALLAVAEAAEAYIRGASSAGFSWPDPNYEALREALAGLEEPG